MNRKAVSLAVVLFLLAGVLLAPAGVADTTLESVPGGETTNECFSYFGAVSGCLGGGPPWYVCVLNECVIIL